jgi:hypothetical protein
MIALKITVFEPFGKEITIHAETTAVNLETKDKDLEQFTDAMFENKVVHLRGKDVLHGHFYSLNLKDKSYFVDLIEI